MDAPESIDSETLKRAQYFWTEYQYRHDLIWQRIFRFTAAIVILAILPYSQQTMASALGYWIIIAPLLAVFLALFALPVIRNELDVFERIVTAYRRQQNKLLDDDLRHVLSKPRDFPKYVGWYLNALVVGSILNLFFAWFYWIPKLANTIS